MDQKKYKKGKGLKHRREGGWSSIVMAPLEFLTVQASL